MLASENPRGDTIKYGASPYNNWVKLIARGRHALCSGGSIQFVARQRARRFPAGLSLRARALRPCSQLTQVLYGLKKIKMRIRKEEEPSTQAYQVWL
jgi:hypothetical protein